MKPIAETLNRMAGDWYDRLTTEQHAEIEDILDAAEQFTLGALPIGAFCGLSTGRLRCLALISTPKEDPRRAPLLRAIDAVLLYQGFVITTCGVWTPEEIGRANMRVHPASSDPWNEGRAA